MNVVAPETYQPPTGPSSPNVCQNLRKEQSKENWNSSEFEPQKATANDNLENRDLGSLGSVAHGSKPDHGLEGTKLSDQDGMSVGSLKTIEHDDFGLPIRPKAQDQRTPRKLSTTMEDDSKLKTKPPSNLEYQRTEEGVFHEKPVNTQVSSDCSVDSKNTPGPAGGGMTPTQAGQNVEQTEESEDAKKSCARDKPKLQVSQWSHQHLNDEEASENSEEDDGGWQDMPALGVLDVYDDFGRLVAKGNIEEEDPSTAYQGLGGSGKGYTRVQVDDEVESVNSLDDDTNYLFKEPQSNSLGFEDDDSRDPLSQLQTTKELLTEGQRIAYIGVVRLSIYHMLQELPLAKAKTQASRNFYSNAIDSMFKWGQVIMLRLYSHMDISSDEQIMIEKLVDHGVQPSDLVPTLMINSRVRNPNAESGRSSTSSKHSMTNLTRSRAFSQQESVPTYEGCQNDDLPAVRTPAQLSTEDKIDIDLRWTVLCDLFLVLVADSIYDSRSRRLLEYVGQTMEVSWLQICRFEKRVVDSLEMQEQDAKETWDETKNMENRRKMGLKSRYMIMGLATVGGGLVIGLSAGLLAPVIGAGLAAGFSTIGITGTGAFLGGTGGTALIASGATLTGGAIGKKASDRRTGAVKTFEYRPLHNNKRLNLIVTVSGWMTGKVDDVRLPFSTVDPIMGDIYSVLWEPEMLQSMGDTINILATEALATGLQQVLGSTVLVALMASLQLPLVLTKLSYLIDNPWNVSLARANAAGLILADSLMNRNLGNRPATLLGFSLGSRVIFSCLKELSKRGAYGLVHNVYMFGSPVVVNKDEYLRARTVVSGRFVNGYASNDWILGYLFRATSGGIMRVAGLAPVNVPGIENCDVTDLVDGHMAYRAAMPRILRKIGWEVESDDFIEIEEPDPENHAERQRELIREIDEARKAANEKPESKRFGLFKRGKLAQKKGWEMYDARNAKARQTPEHELSKNGAVLFDIDAIRAELASEMIEVKQLESTLPPMKLNLDSSTSAQADSNEKIIGKKDKKHDDKSKSDKGKTNQRVDEYDEVTDADSSWKPLASRNPRSMSTPARSLPRIPSPHLKDAGSGGMSMAFDTALKSSPVHEPEEMPMTFDSAFGIPAEECGGMSMTFDTAFESPPEPPTQDDFSNVYLDVNTNSLSSPRQTDDPGFKFGLPGFDTLGFSHNAWADDSPDKESGIQLTFE